MTHGCSPFAVTRRNLTPLDIITAHTLMPGREDVALLLEEAMRGDGWMGGRMEEKRKVLEERLKAKGKREHVRESVAKALQVDQRWWGTDDSDDSADSDLDEEEDVQDSIFVRVSFYTCVILAHNITDTSCGLYIHACLFAASIAPDF